MKVIFFVIKLIIIVICPFIVLIRGAVYLHCSSNVLPMLCVLVAAFFTIIIVFTYLSFISDLFVTGTDNFSDVKRRLLISFVLVSLYVIQGMFYISGSNLKSSDLRSELRKVHPILRLSVSTLIHFDKTLIITDSNRLPEDYKKMGLRQPSHSLHYKQSTGYSHAIDLRTQRRTAFKNFLVQNYFRIMGFRTLRHTGTADHLHISLMSHDRPGAK